MISWVVSLLRSIGVGLFEAAQQPTVSGKVKSFILGRSFRTSLTGLLLALLTIAVGGTLQYYGLPVSWDFFGGLAATLLFGYRVARDPRKRKVSPPARPAGD